MVPERSRVQVRQVAPAPLPQGQPQGYIFDRYGVSLTPSASSFSLLEASDCCVGRARVYDSVGSRCCPLWAVKGRVIVCVDLIDGQGLESYRTRLLRAPRECSYCVTL